MITIDREGAARLLAFLQCDGLWNPKRLHELGAGIESAAAGDFTALAALVGEAPAESAPGVVDAGVVWQSEVPTSGAWRILNPSQPPEFACIAWFDGDTLAGIGLVNGLPFNERMVSNVERMSRDELVRAAAAGGFQFAPLTIPAPPKE